MSFWKFIFGYYIFDAIFGGRRHRQCDDNSIINPFPPSHNNPPAHNDDFCFGEGYDWHKSLGTGHNGGYSSGYDWHDYLGSGHDDSDYDCGGCGYTPPYDPYDPLDDDDDF